MSVRLEIDVTEADIDGGTSTPGGCPVALAANRALAAAGYGGRHYASFLPSRPADTALRVCDGRTGDIVCFADGVPAEAIRFGRAFDAWRCGGTNTKKRPRPVSFAAGVPLGRPGV
jgi:hypothetical protein